MTGTRAETTASATFPAIGTTIGVVCTEARELTSAVELVRSRLAELDRAASRFRPDSELAVINSRSARLLRTEPAGRLRVPVSALLGACLAAATRAERLTGGLVSPSLGAELIACGYDEDIDAVRARTGTHHTPRIRLPLRREAEFDADRCEVVLSAGTVLDLGACAKAWAADAISAELGAMSSAGFLVNLGGDIAAAGPPPPGGWAIGVRDWDDTVTQVVHATGQALATSSTRLRAWVERGVHRHHIIDPRTGQPARTGWAQVTCAGPDAVQANAASTAAIILGDRAPAWLAERGVPARLTAADHQVTTTPGWPRTTPGHRRAS
ncbi:ApbE-like protein [Nocardia nova SH22a]|uniref:FAD:protein FMN transferase n=1 Tax=Nocardia nova SH22a TaxID=1415166 RepID=W5TNT4_9NOCA|nr:FAD:protein FMN transferase [Nocardia nova]AHH18876.1 ApbE-like protein [Nocardia nova SH22a]